MKPVRLEAATDVTGILSISFSVFTESKQIEIPIFSEKKSRAYDDKRTEIDEI